MIIYCWVTAFILGSISRSLFPLIQFPVLHPTRLLIIVVSSGNRTQVLPQCNDSMAEPAGSAASVERAPYCSGKGPTRQKTLLNPWGHCRIVPFLSPQTADSSAWWAEPVPAPGEWRSLTRAPGAPSVMTAGTWTMPMWCAGSWAVEKPSMPRGLLTLGKGQGPSGWTT